MNKYISSFVFFAAGVACLHAADSNSELTELQKALKDAGYGTDDDGDGACDGVCDGDFTISFTITEASDDAAPIVDFKVVTANVEVVDPVSEEVVKIVEANKAASLYFGNGWLGFDDYTKGDGNDASPGIGQQLFGDEKYLKGNWPTDPILFREGWFWEPTELGDGGDCITNYNYTLSYNATTDMLRLDISDVGSITFKEVFFIDAHNITFGNTITVDKLSVVVPAVPEPSAFGLLAGLGALALVASRRRRK